MTDIEKKAREYAGDAIFNAEWNDIEYACEAEKAEEDMKKAFLVGAAYALGNQWRDAEKEKPEDGEMVLIRYFGSISGDKNEVHHCEIRYNSEAKFGLIERMLKSMDVKITHWMPIPSIPEYKPKGE